MLAAVMNLRHLLTLDPCEHPCLGLRHLLTLYPCEHPCLGSVPGATSMPWVKGLSPFLYEDPLFSRPSDDLSLSPKDSDEERTEGFMARPGGSRCSFCPRLISQNSVSWFHLALWGWEEKLSSVLRKRRTGDRGTLAISATIQELPHTHREAEES